MEDHPFGHSSKNNPLPMSNSRFLSGDDEPRLTAILYGTYFVVYSWPPPSRVLDEPLQLRMGEPCLLGSTLFGCRCGPEVSDRLQPVKVEFIEKPIVHACELVDSEAQVLDGINFTICKCRDGPLGDKFVALPINEDIVLFYQRRPGVTYTEDVPYSCFLLFKYLPSEAEIQAAIEGFEVAKRPGGITFKPKNEE